MRLRSGQGDCRQRKRVEMNQVTFDLIKFGVTKRIGTELLRPDVDITQILGEWVITATGRLLGQRDMMEQEVRFPADWWQAFKERWFRGWLLERFPVKYTVVYITVDAVYPELHKKIKMPDEPHRLIINKWTESE